MGNRANVIFVAGERISPCVYLHWHGGPESVYAFLEELDRRQVRADAEYEAARFVQLVGEWFDQRKQMSTLSVGILNGPRSITMGELGRLMTDQGDNGFYVVDRAKGYPLGVRRFTTTYRQKDDGSDWFSMDEWSIEDVARERRVAFSSPQRGRMLDWFEEITEDWKEEYTGVSLG